MKQMFSILSELASDPFAWDDSTLPDEVGLDAATAAGVAGRNWASCDTCWDPGPNPPPEFEDAIRRTKDV